MTTTIPGTENDTSCHPDADSPENVAVASNVPDDDHRFPTCVPVLPVPLKNRTPVTNPSLSDRNFTPSSTEPESFAAVTDGVVAADQIVNEPEADAAVVNDHVVGAASAFPAMSDAPETVAVYTVLVASGVVGVNVATCVVEL